MAKGKLKKRQTRTAPLGQKSSFRHAVDFIVPTPAITTWRNLDNFLWGEGRKNRNNQALAAEARSYMLEAEPLGVANLETFNGNAPNTGYRSRIIQPSPYIAEADFKPNANTSQAIPVGTDNLAESFLSGYGGYGAYGRHDSPEAKARRQELAAALKAYEQEIANEAGTKSYAELLQKKASFMHWLDNFLRDCEQDIKARGRPHTGPEPSSSPNLWNWLNPLNLLSTVPEIVGGIAATPRVTADYFHGYNYEGFYNAVDQHLQQKLDKTRGLLTEEFQLWPDTAQFNQASDECKAELLQIKQNYQERLLDRLSSLDNDPALVLDIKALRQQASQALQDCLKKHDPNNNITIPHTAAAASTITGPGAANALSTSTAGTTEISLHEHLFGTAKTPGRLAEVTDKAVQLRAEMNRKYVAPKGRMQQWRYEYDQEHRQEYQDKLQAKTKALDEEVAKGKAAVAAPEETLLAATVSADSTAPAPVSPLNSLDDLEQAYQGLKANPAWLDAVTKRTQELRAQYTTQAKPPLAMADGATEEQKTAYNKQVADAKQAEANLTRLNKMEAFYLTNETGQRLADLSKTFQTLAQELATIQREYVQVVGKIVEIEHLYDPEQAKYELGQLEAKYKKQAEEKNEALKKTNTDIQQFSVAGLDQSLKVQQQVFAEQTKALTEAQARIFDETTAAAKAQREAADKAYQEHYTKTRLYTLTHGPYPPPTKDQLKSFDPLQQLADLDPDPTHNDRMSFGLVSVSKTVDKQTNKHAYTIHTHSGPGPNSAAHHDREGLATWSHIFSERWNRSSRESEVAATLNNPEKLDDIGLALECIVSAKGGVREINNRFDGFTTNNYHTLLAIHIAAIARGIAADPAKDFDASFKGEWVKQVSEGAPSQVKKWILEGPQRQQVRAEFLRQVDRAKQNYRAAKEFNQACTALLQGGIKPSGVTPATDIPEVFHEQQFQPYLHFLQAVQEATHYDSSTQAQLEVAGKDSGKVGKALDQTVGRLKALNLDHVKGLMADGGDTAGHSAAVLGLVLEKNSALRVLAIKEREIIALIEACHNFDNGLTPVQRKQYLREAERAKIQLLQDYERVADLMKNQGLSVQQEVINQKIASGARIDMANPSTKHSQHLKKRMGQSLELGPIARASLVDRLQMQGLAAAAALTSLTTINTAELAAELPRLVKQLAQVQEGREVGNPQAKLPIDYLVTVEELKDLDKFLALNFATKVAEVQTQLTGLQANDQAKIAFEAAKKAVDKAQAKVDELTTSNPNSQELYDAEKALKVAKRALAEDPISHLTETLRAISALEPQLQNAQNEIRKMDDLLKDTQAKVSAINVQVQLSQGLTDTEMYSQATQMMQTLAKCKEELEKRKEKVAYAKHKEAIVNQLQAIYEKRQAILTTVNATTARFTTQLPEPDVLQEAQKFYKVNMTEAERQSTRQKVPGMLYQKAIPVENYLQGIERKHMEVASVIGQANAVRTQLHDALHHAPTPQAFYNEAAKALQDLVALKAKLVKLEAHKPKLSETMRVDCQKVLAKIAEEQQATIDLAKQTALLLVGKRLGEDPGIIEQLKSAAKFFENPHLSQQDKAGPPRSSRMASHSIPSPTMAEACNNRVQELTTELHSRASFSVPISSAT